MSSLQIRTLTSTELDLVSGGTDFYLRDWTPGGGSYQPRRASEMIAEAVIKGATQGSGSKGAGKPKT